MIDLTVYDLLGEDHTLWVDVIEKDRLEIEILDDKDNKVFIECTHIYAWDSMVNFAQQVLMCDKRVRQKMESMDD